MSDEEIKSYADCIENNRDPFSCWAYNHILNSLNEWNDVMYDYPHIVVTTMIYFMK